MRLAVAALLVISTPCAAIDRIHVRAATVEMAGAGARQVDARLEIHSDRRSTLTLRSGRVKLPGDLQQKTGAIEAVELQCRNPVIHEPRLACPALRLSLRTEKWSTLNVTAQAQFDTARGTLAATGEGPVVAGVTPRFELAYAGAAWKLDATLPAAPATTWLPLLRPWMTLPQDLTLSGNVGGAVHLQGEGAQISATADVDIGEAGFQNADYTWIGEKLAMKAHAELALTQQPMTFALQLSAPQGQALVGPVLLDFTANPLQLVARGTFSPQLLRIESLESRQRDLAQVTATAEVSLSPFAVKAARLDARDVRFPAAYTSYMQLSLATTPFNQLTTTGRADARVRIENNLPVALTLHVADLSFSDDKQQLAVADVGAELNWASGSAAPEQPSWLAWRSARGWGISGDKARLDFAAHDRNFRLLSPTRLPFFDGALRINTLAVRNLGQASMAGDFDAEIEPISVGPIAKALGWPEFAGKLSGRIPGLTYRDSQLTLQGDIEAVVFDGRVVARNLRVRDPLGDWPRIHADITARNLDLDLFTRTFEFGSITGRLDVDLLNLETFGLSPVAFDLRIATPPGDRSRHRISQRAVQNLSNIGGGGGGVTAALQSGFLKFFDEFGYDRLGLSCRLRNDVCQMSGVAPAAGNAFYIVKGSGLPRIDIIGNNQRVAWLTLLAQAGNALANPGAIKVQ
jgi:hypothetical protein